MANSATQSSSNLFKPSLILGWFVAPLLLFIPLSFLNLVTYWASTDSLFYINILKMMTDALHSGVIFPRWFAQANDGLGSPVMTYYAPLAYIITAILNFPLQFLHLNTVYQFLIGIYASQVISGVAAFIWLKNSFSRTIAHIGSLLFVLLPYKFVYIYGHVNLAQLWALAALPIWMLAAERMVQSDKRAIPLYALMFAAVYFAHSLTVLAFGWVPICYVLWFGREQRLVSYSKLLVAHVLGFAMCAMQLLPQHYAFAWIHVEEFLGGRFNWRKNIYHIDIVICGYYAVVALIGVELWKNHSLRSHGQVREGIMWSWVIGAVAFLVTPFSSFIWARITLLQYLQFPCARLHAAAFMGVIYLLCCWLAYYDEILAKAKLLFSKGTAVIILVVFTVLTMAHLYEGNAEPNDLSNQYIANMRDALVIPSAEYKTSWGCIAASDVAHMYTGKNIPAPVTVVSGKASISALQWHPPDNVSFTADVQSGNSDIVVRQCYFPLWNGQVDGQAMMLRAKSTNGLIMFNVPQGSHTILLHYELSSVEQTARIISGIALLISLAMLLMPKKKINPKMPEFP